MKLSVNGLDDLSKSLDNIIKNADSISDTYSFAEIFDGTFMKKYTQYASIDDFFNNSPFDLSKFDDISSNELDKYVSQYTSFSNWEDMKSQAAVDLTTKKLGL